MVPDHFMPAIGLVMVQHAYMDQALQAAISHLSGMNYSVGVSILSQVNSTASRAEIFRNLARIKEPVLVQLAKFLVLADVVRDLCKERNIIAHTLPYAWSPSNNELTYFQEVNKTEPQLKIQPPYLATPESLKKLGANIEIASMWLNLSIPKWESDGKRWHFGRPDDPSAVLVDDARWRDDAAFPWPEKLKGKVAAESKKPINNRRAP